MSTDPTMEFILNPKLTPLNSSVRYLKGRLGDPRAPLMEPARTCEGPSKRRLAREGMTPANPTQLLPKKPSQLVDISKMSKLVIWAPGRRLHELAAKLAVKIVDHPPLDAWLASWPPEQALSKQLPSQLVSHPPPQ